MPRVDSLSNVEAVLMSDGRFVDFSGKRRLQKDSYINSKGEVCVRLSFRNGETRTLTLRPDMLAQFAAHGAERRLEREIVGVKDIQDAVRAIDSLICRFDGGRWGATKDRPE